MTQSKTENNSNGSNTQRTTPIKQSSFLISEMKDFFAFERTCSTVTSGLPEILSFSVVLHTLFGYFLMAEHSLSPSCKNLISSLQNPTPLFRFLQVVIYIITVSTFLCKLVARKKYSKRLWYGLIKTLIRLHTVLTKLMVLITSFLLYTRFEEHIPLLILNTPLVVFDSLYMGNFYLKKEENYQTSHRHSLFFGLGKFIHIVLNILIFRFGSLSLFCVNATFFGALTLIWYSLSGHKLYIHQRPRIILGCLCSAVISSSLLFLLLIQPRTEGKTFSFVEFGVSLAVVSFYLYSVEKKEKISFVSPLKIIAEGKSPKDFELKMRILLEQSDYDEKKETLLFGILNSGIEQLISKSQKNSSEVYYDPLLRRQFAINNMKRQKESIARHFILRLYQLALAQQYSIEKVLDYAQFAVAERADFSEHCFLLEELNENDLSFPQIVQNFKLKLVVKEQSQAFNRLILGGKVELNDVLASEHILQTIFHDIQTYNQRSITIWEQALRHQVDVSVLKGKLSSNFHLIPKINEQWSKISKFLTIQRQWMFAYLNFALFLKNQKIKIKDYAQEQANMETAHLRDSEKSPLLETTDNNSQIKDEVFFDKQVILFSCSFQKEEKLQFLQVSKNFTAITKYHETQVIGSPLDIILPRDLRGVHDKMLAKWLQQGYSVDENSYGFKKTHILDKDSQEIPSLVLFKLYVDVVTPEKLIKFYCLIKTNQPRREQEQLPVSKGNALQHEVEGSHNHRVVDVLENMNADRESGLRLDPKLNIFLKEENLQPQSQMKEISILKLAMRILTISLMILLVFFCFRFSSSLTQIKQDAQHEITVANLYNDAMVLGTFYNLMIEMPASHPLHALFANRIHQVTDHFNKYKTKATPIIFNRDINRANFYPPLKANSINQNISYSQTDIFFILVSAITTLNKHPPLTGQEYDFVQFDAYLQPGYDQMINLTKYRLHQKIQTNLSSIRDSQIIKSSIVSVILVIVFIYVCSRINSFFSNIRQVIHIIIDFSNEEINRIINYWQNVDKHFQSIQGRPPPTQRDNAHNESESINTQNNQPQATLNQKQKNLLFSNQELWKNIKMWVMVGLLMICSLPPILTIMGLNYFALGNMMALQKAGFFMLQYNPTTNILNMLVFNRLYSNTHPQYTFEASRFKDAFSNLQIMIDYHEDWPELNEHSVYLQKLQNYYFGNPCTYNPQVSIDNNIPSFLCQIIANKSFSNGISSCLRFIQPDLIRISQGTLNMSLDRSIDDYGLPLDLTFMYIADAINDWIMEFQTKVDSTFSTCLFLSIMVILVLGVLHFIIFEIYIVSFLQRDYNFMKSVYSACVPEFILVEKKIIKHRFYESGILRPN